MANRDASTIDRIDKMASTGNPQSTYGTRPSHGRGTLSAPRATHHTTRAVLVAKKKIDSADVTRVPSQPTLRDGLSPSKSAVNPAPATAATVAPTASHVAASSAAPVSMNSPACITASAKVVSQVTAITMTSTP